MANKGDTQVQDQTQQQFGTKSGTTDATTTKDPYAPAAGLLQRLIDQYGGINTGVTPEQQAGASRLSAGADSISPTMGADAAAGVNRLFGTDTTPQIGMLSNALSGLQSNIGATASGANLDPMKTPGFGDALSTAMNDITNRVKGVYAGSGRDPSGAGSFAKSLGRGLTEGVSPTIAAEADRLRAEQQGAAGQLYNAGTGTAGAITQQGQVPLANIAQGVGLLPQVIQSYLAPGQAQLAAANTGYNLPFSNLSSLLAPGLQLGAAGSSGTATGNTAESSQGYGTGHGTVTQQPSLLSNIFGGVSGGLGLLSLLSDKRAKTNIKPVGMLNDGQKVYKFRYKGAPQTHIGLLAQEVEKREPDAVSEVGGLKRVDYDAATRGAEAA